MSASLIGRLGVKRFQAIHQCSVDVPVFGARAANVSPRIGHLHVAVDGAQWVWAETSGGPIIIAGLPAGPHKAENTLVNANHQPLDRSVVVEFMIPGGKMTK